jgi:hypothetical protein
VWLCQRWNWDFEQLELTIVTGRKHAATIGRKINALEVVILVKSM